MNSVLIALGANIVGRWGTPCAALRRAIVELRRQGVKVTATSRLYATRPVGGIPQPDYVNAVVAATTRLAPVALLVLCKRLERSAGRAHGPLHGPRPLDLDIICCDSRVIGWPAVARRRGGLILPHPEAHRRAFVLRPLMDVAPRWVHPVLRRRAREILRQLPVSPDDVTALSS